MRLDIRRPSPTTVQYTVSDGRQRLSRVSRVTGTIGLGLRALLGLVLACLFVALLGENVALLGTGNSMRDASRGAVHNWAFEQGLPTGKEASWTAALMVGILLWLLSRQESTGESSGTFCEDGKLIRNSRRVTPRH